MPVTGNVNICMLGCTIMYSLTTQSYHNHRARCLHDSGKDLHNLALVCFNLCCITINAGRCIHCNITGPPVNLPL